MLFNSLDFFVFFIIVGSLYYLLRNKFKWQNFLLLISSYVFYGWWDVRFLLLIVISTAVDYTCSMMIARGKMFTRKKIIVSAFLIISSFVFMLNFQALNPFRLVNGDFQNPITKFGIYVLIGSIVFTGLLNIIITISHNWSDEKRKKFYLILSICSNLTILGFFKYFNFFIESFTNLVFALSGYHLNIFTLNVILPVGISFYTFQTLSYTFDVYWGKLRPTPSLIDFSAYVAFFPQLVAGPIERAHHLIPQFEKPRIFPNKAEVYDALWLILWGLYKKVIVADHMANIVNSVFSPFDSGTLTIPNDGIRLLIGVYAFAFQIYGDFSGYSDIARGTAKLLGFDIRLNFNLPYFATSPSSFWTRWHISLSSWLRDYLYIPLGGNRKGSLLTYRNLFLTMLLGGLWHGASWTFVAWGAYHGIILIVYRLLRLRTEKTDTKPWIGLIQVTIMFHLTCFGWLLFRAQNISTILIFIKSIFGHFHSSPETITQALSLLKFGTFLFLFQVFQFVKKNLNPIFTIHWFYRLNILLFIIMSLLVFTQSEVKEFIYFAF